MGILGLIYVDEKKITENVVLGYVVKPCSASSLNLLG